MFIVITYCPRPCSDVVSARSETSGIIKERESPVKNQVVDIYDRELRHGRESGIAFAADFPSSLNDATWCCMVMLWCLR